MLRHKASDSQPFWGNHYRNIKWIKHKPYLPEEMKGEIIDPEEADYRGQIDIGLVDLDGDKKDETIKVVWGPGVSDHSLTIELVKDGKKIATLVPKGVQPNFKVEDIDSDGNMEIVLWGAVNDPAMSQLASDESKSFEGHSAPHLFMVSIYRLIGDQYELSEEYTTKQKYEPFCEEQPK